MNASLLIINFVKIIIKIIEISVFIMKNCTRVIQIFININDILFSFQASMDLPPDKARLLKNYDLEKKWDMICDQVKITF